MDFSRRIAIVTLLMSTSSVAAQTTDVDFDTFPGGGAVPPGVSIIDQYPGVTFSTVVAACFASTYAAVSMPHSLQGSGPVGDTHRDIYMDFSPAVSRVALNASDVGAAGLTVTAYAGAVAVDSEVIAPVPGAGTGRVVAVELTGAGITRVEATRTLAVTGDFFAIDDLSFTPVVVVPTCGNNIMEAGEACDDGNTLGCDTCAADCGSVTAAGCFVAGVCFPDGAVSGTNTCQVCDPDANGFAFSNLANGSACDDDLFCTAVDSCQGGRCTGTVRSCDDGLGCTTDVCDELNDRCNITITLGCAIDGMCVAAGTPDPLNSCMVCDPTVRRGAYSPLVDGALCDDGAFCTTADICNAGTCGGTPLDCDDGLGCTADSCDDIANSCINALEAESCLIAGVCVAGDSLDPTNECQICRPTTSTTTFTNVMNGTACDDGAFCTDADSCTEGLCSGAVRDCSDGLSCTLDTCDETADECSNDLTAASCTIDGMCVADGALDPSNPCMACNPATNTNAYTPVMDGTACDDGAFCTEVDSCSAGACGGTPRTCDDMLDCTADSCAEAIGECVNFLDGGCLIDGECIAEGTIDEGNACQTCDSELATTEYSPLVDGTLCSDPACIDRTITPGSSCMSATCVASDPMACPGGVACQDGNVCAGGCTMDAQCLADDYCNTDGMCVPDIDNGEDCDRANQCGSGFCAVDDGVCCDTSCSGICQGCGTGACTAYAAGTDPEGECGAEMCNGSAMCEAPTGSDAGPGMDAGADSGTDVDAGTVGGSVTGGSCSAAPATGGSSLPVLGLALFGLMVRRRRR